MKRVGARFCECFGTKKEQRVFYKKHYYKYLWTWGAYDDDQGRIELSISAPPNSLKAKTVRGMFAEAARIIPREHRGGRARIVKPEEVSPLRAEIERVAAELGSLRAAFRHVAEREGMDPRTLKTAIGSISTRVHTTVATEGKGKRNEAPRVRRRDHGAPGRHYRRSSTGSFDEVKLEPGQ